MADHITSPHLSWDHIFNSTEINHLKMEILQKHITFYSLAQAFIIFILLTFIEAIIVSGLKGQPGVQGFKK